MTALVLFMASHENPGLPQVTLQRSEHELALLTFRAPAGHGGYLKWRSNQSANRYTSHGIVVQPCFPPG